MRSANRVARMLATARPELVAAVSLVAANVGRNPSPPNVRAAIRLSADLSAPDDERVKAMQFVFFAPGSDARVWLKGWYPDVLAAQRAAGDRTSREIDYAAGKAPILYIQPSHDPLARVDEAEEYKHALGGRVTVVVIPNSGPCGRYRAAQGRQRRADRLCAEALAGICAEVEHVWRKRGASRVAS